MTPRLRLVSGQITVPEPRGDASDVELLADLLTALGDSVRTFHAYAPEGARLMLVRILDEHSIELGGVNVPDLPPEGDDRA